MATKKIIINLIQDLATPHNNVLIEQFVGRDDVEIKLWYAKPKDVERYQWNLDISQQHIPAKFYGEKLNLSFLRYCLTHKFERFVIVGWMNSNTRLLHLLFFLLRRQFNHWTDLPNPKLDGMQITKKFMRWAVYKLLRYSRCKVFGVGKITLDCFRTWSFPEHMLINLPIFVTLDDNISVYREQRSVLFERYSVPAGGFLLSAGSRLIHEKGYDLLIGSIRELTPELRNNLRLVIVGSGEESAALKSQIYTLGLQDTIRLESWLNINDFKALIANSHIFIHPARFDSFGGTTLGMALGVPVIGTTGAGAAIDRIEHGINGFLYEATDIHSLAGYITRLLTDYDLRQRMGSAGRQTALNWHPSRGVDILLRNSI
jgi:glycosyltransferase involved in cell wall biosynthesis